MSADRASTDPYAAIADVYDVWCAEVVEDVAFYVTICDDAALPVIELGAGTGRISVPLARVGHDVVAVDRSAPMLDRLRLNAGDVADRITIVEADVEALPPLGPADRIVVPFRMLLHVPTDERRLAVLRRCHEILVPGGLLAFDVFQPTRDDIRATHDRELRRGSGVVEVAHWDDADNRLDLDIRFRGRRTTMNLHYVPGHRWGELLEEAGFEIVAAYEGFEGRRFRGRRGDSAWVGRRP